MIGGGFGGIATAARLAKLGHRVSLLESGPALGGALSTLTRDGFTWERAPAVFVPPAVVRDLFRKTGRPLESELELTPYDVVREHHFVDGSEVSLPGGSRAGQLRAVEGLGTGLGRRWVEYVDSLTDDWELLRRHVFERPWDPATGSRDAARRLASRESLARRLAPLADERLRLLGAYPMLAQGHELRRVPAWMGVWPYLEQRFGAWRVEGGVAALLEALSRRLSTRRVEVRTGLPVRDLVVRAGRVVAVATSEGEVPADAVVCAVDPRTLPALATYVARTDPAPLPRLTHLGLEQPPLSPAAEVIWHGDPLVALRHGTAPEGTAAVTLLTRSASGDPVAALAARGVALRVVTRIDETADELGRRWGGSPYGVLWRGRGTARRRLGPTTPIRGVFAAGAHATPGAGLAMVGLSASLVAQAIGPADQV